MKETVLSISGSPAAEEEARDVLGNRRHRNLRVFTLLFGSLSILKAFNPHVNTWIRAVSDAEWNSDCPHGFVLVRAADCTNSAAADFCIQRYEVTSRQYSVAMGNDPSLFPRGRWDVPVTNVTWHDAIAYANALNDAEGYDRCEVAGYSPTDLQKCRGFRLPTFNETACAAGVGTSDPENLLLTRPQWVEQNPSSGARKPVGWSPRNEHGINDLFGNVKEWMADGPTNVGTCIGTIACQRYLFGRRFGDNPRLESQDRRVVSQAAANESSPFIGFRLVRAVR